MHGMTRRTLLEAIGKAGGTTAVYSAMTTLGLLATPEKQAFALSGKSGGKRVLILGAGLAGMCSAYELGKLGYNCHILEARSRAGGRCHTIKRGQVEVDTDGEQQVCDFDEGLYLNPGPARIPQHHVTLDYCRELGVAVEMFNNENQNAYLYHEDTAAQKFGPLAGKRVRMREAKADLYGYTSELLAKAVSKNALDAELTLEDKERLVAFLHRDGGLCEDLFYRNGNTQKSGPRHPLLGPKLPFEQPPLDRRGYRVLPRAARQSGEKEDPFDLHALIQSGFGFHFQFPYDLDQQMTMFQVVGGTHGIAKAFERKLPGKITFGAIVQEIRQQPGGVRVVYKDTTGHMQEATADFCICAIPLSVLKSIPADFAPPMKQAIGNAEYAPSGKIGFQFKRRFWEEDDRIYGGISWTNLPITQIWYPATGFMGKKGVMVGYYNYEDDAIAYGNLKHKEREARALAEGSKIHPQYKTELETSFSVAWHKTPYNLGAWASYREERGDFYNTLNEPDGRIYLAGEHLSYLTGWMAGALESARKVTADLHQRASKEAQTPRPTRKGTA